MAISNTTIQIKKSVVSGNTPSSLANGEIAINSADGKLFYRTPSGSISSIQNQQSFATVNANSSLILATSGTDTLSIVPGNGITIAANTTSKTITINSTATGGGAFNYWQNTAPTSANSHDFWTNSDTGVMYENFGTPSSPVWAEVGPTGVLANTLPGAINGTSISINGNQAVNGPAFSAYPNSAISQTITAGGTQQKVLFQLEEYDTNNNFASSRFTPTVAGYYQLNATVRLDGGNGTGECMIVIWKNGTEYKRGWNSSGTQFAASFWSMGVSTTAYANGTTDYFEVYVQQGNASSLNVTVAGGNITYFNGCMLRGA
jgi:hypothetical protein